MPPRPGLIIAAVLAAVAVCGCMLALTLPGFLHDWRSAQLPARHRSERVQPAKTARSARGDRDSQRPTAVPGNATPAARHDDWRNWPLIIALWFGGWTVTGGLALSVLAGVLVRRRIRNRRRRDYERYELHLSMHDEAKPQDLEEMVEAIANVVRVFPEERARDGQPFIAFELHYGPGEHGDMEWTLAVRCESKVAKAIDGEIAAAYPDVRVGQRHGEDPQPMAGTLREPGYVLRYRKARSFVYALNSAQDRREGSPPIEAIAQAQVALGETSCVRIQLIPAPVLIEDWARRRFRRHENRLVRSETWGASEAGLRGSLDQQEMRDAKRTQNRSMFWMEVQVAARTRAAANRVGSRVQASRGDNRLHRRWMIWPRRLRLYRERFATAYPPLWPTPTLRSLVSAAEVAHMLELPSARMKGVPVRRMALPRLPAPPDVERALAGDVVPPPPEALADDAIPTPRTAAV